MFCIALAVDTGGAGVGDSRGLGVPRDERLARNDTQRAPPADFPDLSSKLQGI